MNLRDLAEGEPCDLRAPGVCNFRTDTTVLAHIKRGHCGSIKPSDLAAIRACFNCHDLIDGRRHDYTRDEVDVMLLRALCQQLNDYDAKEIVRW